LIHYCTFHFTPATPVGSGFHEDDKSSRSPDSDHLEREGGKEDKPVEAGTYPASQQIVPTVEALILPGGAIPSSSSNPTGVGRYILPGKKSTLSYQ